MEERSKELEMDNEILQTKVFDITTTTIEFTVHSYMHKLNLKTLA